MTENKRFEIISVDYTNIDIPVYVVKYGDVCFAVYEDKEDVQKICDLLNELNDENKQLKKQRDCVYGDLTRLKKDYLELTDENKNLKAQNELIKMEIEEMRKLWGSK